MHSGNNVENAFVIFEKNTVITLRQNEYIIQEYLGGGAAGHVYRVKNNNQEYFLKISIGTFGRNQVNNEIEKYKLIIKNSGQAEKDMFLEIKDVAINQKIAGFVGELMDKNLFQILEERDYAGFRLDSVQYIGRILVKQLCFLHRLNLIHTDIKPENIMVKDVNNVSIIKLIDFGGMITSDEKKKKFYIQTQFYRAPEVILKIEYDCKIDVWSLGCVLAELYLGLPIFAGDNDLEILKLIEIRLGIIPSEVYKDSPFKKKIFNENGTVKQGVSFKDKVFGSNSKLDGIIYGVENNQNPVTELFLDLLNGMLDPNHETRFSIEDVRNHEFFQKGLNNIYNNEHKNEKS